jgi:chemosensory pili system protein ChpB (putative protein-glutamate methylesterase)
MDKASQPDLRVALLADGCDRNAFRILLQQRGLEVVADDAVGLPLPSTWSRADVLLLAGPDTLDLDQVQQVLEQSPVPVLINRGGIANSEVWQHRLVSKLRALAVRGARNRASGIQHSQPELRVVRQSHAGRSGMPWLVVLGASIGGPKAVARFLRALPDKLPVAFLLAQHISEPFQELLVEQLDRCSAWPVAMLGEAQNIKAGQVWMVPAGNRIEMNAEGTIRCSSRTWESAYQPDINMVLRGAAEAFGSQCGAIMFSGLGKDGTQGCASVADGGGFVWAQSSESCVIANLPEAARRSCKVELSGTPEQLARALVSRCTPERTSIN